LLTIGNATQKSTVHDWSGQTLWKGGEKRMKRIVKLALVVLPALLLATTVGLSTMGCDDDTTVMQPPDLTVPVVIDMAVKG
jgi:hypothetical protein